MYNYEPSVHEFTRINGNKFYQAFVIKWRKGWLGYKHKEYLAVRSYSPTNEDSKLFFRLGEYNGWYGPPHNFDTMEEARHELEKQIAESKKAYNRREGLEIKSSKQVWP